ncbi:hypothetical protein BCD48_39110 [Pseudofrankia sp. BMG5.36]|nr:hypothetical protein BCD48_39110 [Pseudofrankia sp. BMG5.36]
MSWLIKQAFHYTRRAADEAMRAHGVTSAQGGVLIRLAQRPGLSAADLARLMFITPQAAQQTLTALEGLGLVERSADPNNARILRAVLTTRGLEVATGCRADALEVEQRLLGVLDADERKAFTDFLLRYMCDSPPADE